MFLFLFKAPYEAPKDYMLRNELRLLSDEIKKVLVKAKVEKELAQNVAFSNFLLLKTLYNRSAFDLFKLEFKEIYDQAVGDANYFAAWAISSLNYSMHTKVLHEKEANLEVARQMNEWQITQLSSFYVTAYRSYQLNEVYLRNLKYPFLLNNPQTEKLGAGVLTENEYATYLLKKANCYLLPPRRRIEAVKECLEFAASRVDESPIYQEEVKYAISELAMLHCLLFDFEKADEYYNRFFELEVEPDDPFRLAVLADYIAKLLKQKRTSDAIDWIQLYRHDIEKIEKLGVRLKCLEVAAFAFSGDAEKLQQVLPENFADFSRPVRHFFRLHYAILAWLSKESDGAVRELDNLLNVIQKGEPPVFDVRPVARLMRRYFNGAAMPKGSGRTRNLEKVQADLVKYEQEAAPVYKSYLPLVWLKMELGN